MNQSGGSIAEPSLEQNQSNFPRTGSGTGYRTGPKIESETGSRTGPGPIPPSIPARAEIVSVDTFIP